MQRFAIRPAITRAGPRPRSRRCHSFHPKAPKEFPPRLDVLAGDPVDFELFSGSIKQGLQSGIKGVSLLCALWESWSCGLARLFVRHGIPA